MDSDCLIKQSNIVFKGRSQPCRIIPLQGSAPHAVLLDLSHDNESPSHRRTARDALPTGGLVTFTWASIGSVKGFDDLYPKLLDLVTDSRMYEKYEDATKSGIGKAKRILNHLHTEMILENFSEGHMHQEADVSLLRCRWIDIGLD